MPAAPAHAATKKLKKSGSEMMFASPWSSWQWPHQTTFVDRCRDECRLNPRIRD
jgi:hypothetical protein